MDITARTCLGLVPDGRFTRYDRPFACLGTDADGFLQFDFNNSSTALKSIKLSTFRYKLPFDILIYKYSFRVSD
jgi:hypothetical protein